MPFTVSSSAMTECISRIFPAPVEQAPLHGLYLTEALPTQGKYGPYIYANYVTSLDGRIAVPDPTGQQSVPGHVANPRDWRLLQELAGQADLLLSSGRYLRELKAGTAQDILPIGSGPKFADIHEYRRKAGLKPQPDVAVLSESLDFPPPLPLLEQGRRIIVLTGQAPDPARAAALEAAGLEVRPLTGVDRPGGLALANALAQLSYRRIYVITGPYVMHTLMAQHLVDSLFLTTVHRLLGGQPFSSICEGPLLSCPADYRLAHQFLDPVGPDGCSQTFSRFDRLAP
ncbi:pyrimidine reductase [Spiribacter sp. C176]|uniref:Pyrimidine reductase n=1 Tax=Spiribacter salilacus TaxID=2664894 RepID=A0A6N7QLE9_9GAMM|nr:dihydrofolate reductase family protein [Spiribacter salilacus]MRH77315.1 pyrimidine reductase [Spiribacter salilacus]